MYRGSVPADPSMLPVTLDVLNAASRRMGIQVSGFNICGHLGSMVLGSIIPVVLSRVCTEVVSTEELDQCCPTNEERTAFHIHGWIGNKWASLLAIMAIMGGVLQELKTAGAPFHHDLALVSAESYLSPIIPVGLSSGYQASGLRRIFTFILTCIQAESILCIVSSSHQFFSKATTHST